MHIVTVNVGTSSIKTARFVATNGVVSAARKVRAYPLNNFADCIVERYFPDTTTIVHGVSDQETALLSCIEEVMKGCLPEERNDILFAFRVVHGGEKLHLPTKISDEILSYLESIQELAPLHNPPAMSAIKSIREQFPHQSLYAVFDTAFHTAMPEVASSYAISPEMAGYHVKRYGFHGLAHASMLSAYCGETHTSPETATLITLQLGSGCSICAIKSGKSVDTSMGFSPLEGLVSRTRSGQIDPAVIPFLSRKMNRPAEKIVELLNKNAGLAGMTETEGQMSDLLSLEQSGNSAAKTAVDLFCYRTTQYIGAYMAVIGKPNAIIFGGGVSEHCPDIIRRVLASPLFDIRVLPEIAMGTQPLVRISNDDSSIPVYLSLVDEEQEMVIELDRQLTLTSQA